MDKDPFLIENATCSCPTGLSEGCGHVIGLLYHIAKFKLTGIQCVPEDVAKTSLTCTWRLPRGEKIGGKEMEDVEVFGHKLHPEDYEDPPKPIKSTLYNPIRCPIPSPVLLYDALHNALPSSMMLDFLTTEIQNSPPQVITRFGSFPRGSVLSYQQKLSSDYIFNNYADTNFPNLPATNNMTNNLSLCLTKEHALSIDELTLSDHDIQKFEVETRVQSSSNLWHKLRKGRITASNVGAIVKRGKEDVSKFISQLKSTKKVHAQAMKQGLAGEPLAAAKYSSVCDDNVNVYPCGTVISPTSPWLAASPDRKVYNPSAARISPHGLLEIKCPESDTITDVDCLNRDAGGFLYLNRRHNYYYQVMAQLAVTGLPWCDFFVWCAKDDTHHLETIVFDEAEWQEMKDKLDIFFFEHYIQQ